MNRTPKVLRGCCGIGLWALLLTPTWANWQDAVPGAQIIGTGDFSVFGFDVYNARLWSAARPLVDGQPFALELIYRRNISRDDLVKASVDEIKRLAGARVSPAPASARRNWPGGRYRCSNRSSMCRLARGLPACICRGRARGFLSASNCSTRLMIRCLPGRFSISGSIRAHAILSCASSCWG